MYGAEMAFPFIDGKNIRVLPCVLLSGGKAAELDYRFEINEKFGTLHIFAENELLSDDLYINYCEKEAICKRVVKNISGEMLKIKELGFRISGIDFAEEKKDDYFYHAENPRIYETMTFPIDYDRCSDIPQNTEFDVVAGNKWADPGVITERIGACPYQPFPALLVSNYNTRRGLVHGTLSQKLFYHNYLLKHESGAIVLDIFSSFKDIDALEVSGGRSLTDEWYIGKTERADDIEKIFEGYTAVLRDFIPNTYGNSRSNRNWLSWGSWNDGIFRNVSEELILKEAEFLKENFPTVKWIQLDDGYSHCKKIAHGLGVAYEGDDGIDKNRFPRGLRSYTDKIRALGLRPSLWIGGSCPCETKIFKEKPQWFIDYTYRTENTEPLDVSQPEVREYMKGAIEKLCVEYGFDGVKHDFWSYAFEDSHDLYKYKDKSGYEYRSWWLGTIRSCLPGDGYLQTGCDIVMGNPFLSEYFNNYRYGIDIGNGNWEQVKTSMQWGAACFATHTGDLFVPNSDSVGLLPGLSEREALFCINYCLVTHSMVELAGKLSESKDEKRLKILKKAVCCPNNGQDVYFIGFDYRGVGRRISQIMYFKTPHFSLSENSGFMPQRTVGFFNTDEEEKEFKVLFSDMELSDEKYIVTDVWSGESFEACGGFSAVCAPHESRLFAVSKIKGVQLLDANVKVLSVSEESGFAEIELDYDVKDAELLFSHTPIGAEQNGAALDFSANGGRLALSFVKSGRLKVYFEEEK